MDLYESLSHTRWECKYHVIFVPKRRRKVLYERVRKHLGEVFKQLAEQKESKVLEGHLMPDHVHAAVDTTEVCSVAGSGIHQGKERHSSGAGLWRNEEEFHGPAFLGAWISGVNGREE